MSDVELYRETNVITCISGKLAVRKIHKHELNIWLWLNTEAKGVKEFCWNKKHQEKSNYFTSVVYFLLFFFKLQWFCVKLEDILEDILCFLLVKLWFTAAAVLTSALSVTFSPKKLTFLSIQSSKQKTFVFFQVTTGFSNGLFSSS